MLNFIGARRQYPGEEMFGSIRTLGPIRGKARFRFRFATKRRGKTEYFNSLFSNP